MNSVNTVSSLVESDERSVAKLFEQRSTRSVMIKIADKITGYYLRETNIISNVTIMGTHQLVAHQ